MFPILRLSSEVYIPTYPAILCLTAILTLIYGFQKTQKQQLSLSEYLNLFLIISISGIFGARALHVIWENPFQYYHHPAEIFFLWNGGFVYLGGLVTSFIAFFIYCKIKHLNIPIWLDHFTSMISLSYTLGRWACFFAGCCYGKQCDLPWGIHFFPEELFRRHPTQIYSSLWEFLLFSLLVFWVPNLRTKLKLPNGLIFSSWLFFHSLGRFFIEFLRDDFRGLTLGLSISGWISLFLMTSTLFFIIYLKFKKNNSKS